MAQLLRIEVFYSIHSSHLFHTDDSSEPQLKLLGDKTEVEEETDDHDVNIGNPIERVKFNDGTMSSNLLTFIITTTFPNDITGVVRFIYLHLGNCSVLPTPAGLSNEDADKDGGII